MEILGAVYMDQEKSNAALSAYLGAAKASSKLKGSSVLRTANLLFGYQYIDQSKRYISQLRPRLNELTPDEQLKLKTLEAKIARSEGDNGAAMAALHDIILKDNRNGEARVELAQLYAILAGEAEEETKKAEHLARAKLYFDQAMQIEDSQAMAALRYGQMLVGQAEYIKAVPLLKKAYELRPRDEVDQYVKRVERAARRQQEKEDADRKAASLPTTG
jgi:thioredoxin-like negative regulator of GroEL